MSAPELTQAQFEEALRSAWLSAPYVSADGGANVTQQAVLEYVRKLNQRVTKLATALADKL